NRLRKSRNENSDDRKRWPLIADRVPFCLDNSRTCSDAASLSVDEAPRESIDNHRARLLRSISPPVAGRPTDKCIRRISGNRNFYEQRDNPQQSARTHQDRHATANAFEQPPSLLERPSLRKRGVPGRSAKASPPRMLA